MSNLRWIERDGKMVLQFRLHESVWQDVPTHKEPKKVSVEEELTKVISKECYGAWTCESVAGVAIEFFRARMPKRECVDHYSQVMYNQALKDVSKALFGEE